MFIKLAIVACITAKRLSTVNLVQVGDSWDDSFVSAAVESKVG